MDKNYFKVPNSIFGAGLTKYELLVLIYLVRCLNNKHIAFPSYQDIAKCCAISRSKAVKIVSGLAEKGILRKQIRSHSYRKNHSNLYAPSTQALKRNPEAGAYSLSKASGYCFLHSSI